MNRALAIGAFVAIGTLACGGSRPSPVLPESRVVVFTRAPMAGCYDAMPTIVVGDGQPEGDETAVAFSSPTQDYARLASSVRERVEACRAERAGAVGAITFRFVVLPNGEVGRVKATSSVPAPLVACATRALETLQTDPPSCGGATTSLVVLFR